MKEITESTNETVDQSKKVRFLSKFKVAIIICLCIALLIVGGVYYKNNRWKHDLNVVYVGTTCEPGTYTIEYDEYEITNNTNRTLKNVTVVIKIEETVLPYVGSANIEKSIGMLRAGETKTVKIYRNALETEIEKTEKHFYYWTWDILRIIYD